TYPLPLSPCASSAFSLSPSSPSRRRRAPLPPVDRRKLDVTRARVDAVDADESGEGRPHLAAVGQRDDELGRDAAAALVEELDLDERALLRAGALRRRLRLGVERRGREIGADEQEQVAALESGLEIAEDLGRDVARRPGVVEIAASERLVHVE